MRSPDLEVAVLIVGGGPAGLTASLLLSRHGIESLLVDKRATPSPLPRARGVHARAMEIMRVCGVEPALRAVELPITPGAQWRPRLTDPPIREDVPSAAVPAQVSPCEGLAVSQDVFERVLREHACGYSVARLCRGVALESFTANDGGIQATVLDQATGERSRIRARWLIAADGARSSIRDHLGIRMDGPADLGRQRMIAFRADLSGYTGLNPCGIYFLTDTGAALIWTHPDHRWVISLPDADDEGRDPQTIVRDVLGVTDTAVEVSATNRWTAAAQVAQRYRHGPVFLVGDAAHRFPPAGATGVSAAMHDAHNLAWKLAAVWHGHAGPALLDSYADEREAVGQRNADETGTAWTRVFNGDGVPFAGRSLAQIDMGYQYRSAVISHDGTPDADPPGSDYHPTANPGCRAPHLWLNTADGRRSTIDLFDSHLTLLTAPPGAQWRTAADHAARAYRLPMHSHVVPNAEWPDQYGVTPTGAVLVRPDGHVTWRSQTIPGPDAPTTHAQIRTALSTCLATTTAPTHSCGEQP
jgi:putative polyketide hydroxylase